MYKIVFKTRDTEPLMISEEKGKRVWDLWLADKRTRIVVNDFAFNTVDIKSIKKTEESQAKKSHVPKRVEDDYDDFRRKMLSLTIEARANLMRIPNMVWKIHTEKEMPDDVKSKIKEKQLAFFKENPKCIFTNPAEYKSLIERKVEILTKSEFKETEEITPGCMMQFIENIIRTDLQYSLKS